MTDISSTFIIKSGINIIFGALWLWWIYKLGAKENEDKKCKNIEPMLRIFLKIVAWVLLVTCIITVIIIISFNNTSLTKFNPYTRLFLIISVILLALVYIIQIRYISEIENSSDKEYDTCGDISKTKKIIIIVISILIIISGIVNIVKRSNGGMDIKNLNKMVLKNAKKRSSSK